MSDETQSYEQKMRDLLLHKAEQIKQRPYRRWHTNFGMIASLGGVIIVPIILGLFVGGYLDEVLPQKFSWRLSGLFLGFVWGGFNAYWWIKIEDKKIADLSKIEQDNGANENG